jgi:hypothetical protein
LLFLFSRSSFSFPLWHPAVINNKSDGDARNPPLIGLSSGCAGVSGAHLSTKKSARPSILPEDVALAETCLHQSEQLVRCLPYREWQPLRVIPTNNNIHGSLLLMGAVGSGLSDPHLPDPLPRCPGLTQGSLLLFQLTLRHLTSWRISSGVSRTSGPSLFRDSSCFRLVLMIASASSPEFTSTLIW